LKEISLAIPFYNSSQYFLDAVKYAIENPFVKEIVVSDDHSNEYNYDTLKNIVENLKSKKIKIIRPEKNLGGFKNKYFVVSKCNYEWIYLLDSDNCMTKNTLQLIKSIKKFDLNICYCPKKLILFHNNQPPHQEVTYNFEFDSIGIDEIKILLRNNVKWVDWFLNTGNYFFNRDVYLNCLDKNNSNETFAGDVIAASYYWFKNGGKFKIIEGFEYYHRLRSDSYWNSCGTNSSQSVEKYKSKILSL